MTPLRLNTLLHWFRSHDIVAAALVSLLLVVAVSFTTSPTPPSADSINYVNVAEQGLWNNPDLAAPFAYRFGTPLIVHAMSFLLSLSILASFRLVVFLSVWGLCVLAYLLARSAGGPIGSGLVITAVAAFSFFNVKFPLAVPTMVDAEGFLLFALAVWLLVTKRYGLALLTSCVGLFFKEFLLIPGALLIFEKAREYWKSRAASPLIWILATVLLVGSCFVVPRILIGVSTGYGANLKWIFPAQDHFGYFENLRYFLSGSPNIGRIVNLVFSLASYWFPFLLLATPERVKMLSEEMGSLRWLIILLVLLVLVFALFGGTNIMIFVAYTLPALVIALAFLLRLEVHWIELVAMLAAMFLFNRISTFTGGMGMTSEDIVQFYGGWWTKLDVQTVLRTVELGCYLAGVAVVRVMLRRIKKASVAAGKG